MHRVHIGRIVIAVAVVSALATLAAVRSKSRANPRTDDATVRANYIEVAPEVSGRIVRMAVRENQAVAPGDLLFAIDTRPFDYELAQALADQKGLEKQIDDARRRIGAERAAVEVARASIETTRANAETAGRNVDVASAAVERAEAAVHAADAEFELASNNLHRLEPLLRKQYVTVEQVDHARVAMRVAEQRQRESQAALNGALAAKQEAAARFRAAQSQVPEARARLDQSRGSVDTLDSLIAQRPARASRVDTARLNVERCRVVAPFAGYVTNFHMSEGTYATTGKPVFTLIDRRNWYVVANYRESDLRNIAVGRAADVYLMSHPDHAMAGVVDSIGYGVFPEYGGVSDGLPVIDKTLNWVHLAARFPVRIRIMEPDPSVLRMGESAVSIVR